jgi:hypothetical protein
MAHPETFTVSLHCPNCRTTGEVICAEHENPAPTGRRFDRMVLSASKGFQPGGNLDGIEQVICSSCQALIPI